MSVRDGQPPVLTVTASAARGHLHRPQPQTRTVRFAVVSPEHLLAFAPPNIILPAGANRANRTFTIGRLPPDFAKRALSQASKYSRAGAGWCTSRATAALPGAEENSAGTYYYLLTYTTGRRYKGWVEVMQKGTTD
ncbi:MAG: hypothetical protein WKG07_04565 [Hymenobacter sp.]